jgi:hypothetical protein
MAEFRTRRRRRPADHAPPFRITGARSVDDVGPDSDEMRN